jgi:hypothetical protein
MPRTGRISAIHRQNECWRVITVKPRQLALQARALLHFNCNRRTRFILPAQKFAYNFLSARDLIVRALRSGHRSCGEVECIGVWKQPALIMR